ncbi:MAG: protease modulator HflK [Deltaproteobacteria bacterium]|nr:protease modulator HflK [Deltaproteobacteria bacterium]
MTRSTRNRTLLGGALLLAGWLALGIYNVESDESAVAYVLGKAVGRDVLPGIHWNPPWPLGQVVVARTATNFLIPVEHREPTGNVTGASESLWLLGDTNVIVGRLGIQYSIGSLTRFEVSHEDPRELLRRAGRRIVTRFLAGESVDAALTTRRNELLDTVQRRVQAILDDHGSGIEIQSVNVEALAPPEQGGVRQAFQEVQSALADKERVVDEARADRAQILAEAEGEAEHRVTQAEAARHRRVEIAKGEGERFLRLAREHRKTPGLTEERLYLETIEEILPRMDTYVVQAGPDGKVNLRVVR